MRKTFLITLMMCISLISVSALDMDSKKIFENPLNENSADFKKAKSAFSGSGMKAEFNQTKSVAKFNRSLKSSGTMLLKTGKGMAWITKKPYESVMVVGKDSLKQKVAGGKVISQNVEGNAIYVAIAEAMENVFGGRFSLLHNVFKSYFLKDNDSWYIGLIPKSGEFASFVSFITISGKKCIEKVFMKEAGGNSILYEFNNVELRELYGDEEEVFSL